MIRTPGKPPKIPETATEPPQTSSEEATTLTPTPLNTTIPPIDIIEAPKQISPPKIKYVDRTSEAKACLTKTKLNLSSSRNTKTEIKTAISEAAERLFQLVKEAEVELKATKLKLTKEGSSPVEPQLPPTNSTSPEEKEANSVLLKTLEQHTKLLAESNKQIGELNERMDLHKVILEKASYAKVAATGVAKSPPGRGTLHSIVVTSKDDTETGDQVLDKIRNAVDAKEGWVKVERVRKAKDSKIIMGFQTREERNKVKNRLEEKRQDLSVEEMRNKDPLLILRGVLSINSDEEVLRALRNQNRDVFRDLDKEEDRIEVKYRRRTRNPHVAHVVVGVSPIIWRRAIELGRLHVELQRVRVEDQTPLVQCTCCLGYGHGRRFCKEPADLCSHCGGPHLKSECADCLAGVPPKCQNCTRAKLDDTDHNAFSPDCPTRHKWDEIARSTVAYC